MRLRYEVTAEVKDDDRENLERAALRVGSTLVAQLEGLSDPIDPTDEDQYEPVEYGDAEVNVFLDGELVLWPEGEDDCGHGLAERIDGDGGSPIGYRCLSCGQAFMLPPEAG